MRPEKGAFFALLPTMNYITCNQEMERIKQLFYRAYPSSDEEFNYRLGPLSSDESFPDAASIPP